MMSMYFHDDLLLGMIDSSTILKNSSSFLCIFI